MTVKPSISLTDEQHAFAADLVASGRYSSLSAVLQQGLDVLRMKIEAEEADTRALRALIARRASGPFISGEAMDARLDAMIARKRVALGLQD